MNIEKNRKIDLTDYLDICVITNGRGSFKYVVKSLERQKNVKFDMTIFENMTWLDACNACLNYSNLPFYLRLDDDMLLHPLALHFFDYIIKNNDMENAVVCYYKLWEPWNKRLCGAVKVYNRELAKTIGFETDNRGKVDKIFKRKAGEKKYIYISNKKNAIGIHAACSFDDNMRYTKLRKGERNRPDFEIRRKEIIYLDKVLKETPLSKQFEMADRNLYELNRKNNTRFAKFVEKNRGE